MTIRLDGFGLPQACRETAALFGIQIPCLMRQEIYDELQ
jgi:hypothetical protein